jgi:7-cyano-7-deazaguanine synthase
MPGSVVLFSGGLDSAVLLALELTAGFDVLPVHVRAGFRWEAGEAAAIARLLAAVPFHGRVAEPAPLALDMRDVYPTTHWAITGDAPGYEAPDAEVYLAGRNIVLTAKTAVLASQLGVERIAIGPLSGNPFPDATPAFFDTMSLALSRGLATPIRIVAPLVHLSKPEVIRQGVALQVPLALTMSCLRPAAEQHCGDCNKCRERQEAFDEAGIIDPTAYVTRST